MSLIPALLFTLVVITIGTCLQPTSAQCPPGWNLHEGVRRSGEFACYAPLPPGCGEPVGEYIPCPKVPIVRGAVYCRRGTQPIVVDWRTVECRALP